MATWRSHTEDKKARDREQLDRIYKDYKTRDLTKEELRFLYEIDEEIIGYESGSTPGEIWLWGYDKDPRIKEIISSRNIRQDLARVFDCPENQISLTEEEALQGNILYHHGNLNLRDLTDFSGVPLPEIIGGDLDCSGADAFVNIIFPKIVRRDLYSLARSFEHVILPEIIGRDLILARIAYDSVISVIDTVFPKEVGRGMRLDASYLKGIILPPEVGGTVELSKTKELEDTALPEIIGKYLALNSLVYADNTTPPKEVGDNIELKGFYLADFIYDRLPISLPNKFGGLTLSNGNYTYEELQEIRQRLIAINKTIEELQQEKSLLIRGSERVRKRTRNMN